MNLAQEAASKFGQAFAALAVFFGVLLILFFVGARLRGRAQGPAAFVVMLGPAILLLLAGLVVPVVQTLNQSLYNSNGKKFVGLANYSWVFTTPDNRQVLINTLLWLVVAPLLSTTLGLTLALLLDRMRRESIPKSLIFMPMAISFVGAGIIWSLVYEYRDPAEPQVGLLSQLVMWLGVDDPPQWLLWQPFNSFLLMVIMIWIQTGFAMVVLSAAIKAIPSEVVEAAMLDGAVGWRLFRRVTIPMIRTTVIVVLTTIMIAVLKIFDIVQTMTGGNFGTNVLANEMYTQAFTQQDKGRGSALAVVLFIAVLPIVIYNIIQLRRERAIR